MPAPRLGPEYDTLRNRGTPIMSMIYIGFVKRNDDAQRMGRLSVWIPEMGGDPKQESSWVVVSYASPFAGATSYTGINSSSKTMDGSQTSYGFWGVPPHLDNEVGVFFANGDLARGYWFCCTFQTNMNHMVPGVATNTTTDPAGQSQAGPVVEYNKANVVNTKTPARPRFMPLSDGLNSQGLVSDNERGSSTTSARREAPSQVFGLISPRSNSIHIDDNVGNEFIRLRTRSGTQIIVDETTGFVYIVSKLGNAWMEVSDAGVDVYSANCVSIRAQQDFNVRADRNIIFDANQNIEMRAGQQITMESGTDINISADKNLALTVTANASIHSQNDLKLKADANIRLESGADTSLKATGNQDRDGASINDNAGLSPPASVTDAVVPQGKVISDVTQGFSNGGSGTAVWKAGGGTVNTIVSRMPEHEPWSGHPNSAVPPPPTNAGAIPPNPGNLGGAPNSANNPSNLSNDGCSFGVSGTKPISTEAYTAITNASSQTGAPAATMFAIADQESSFNTGAQNPNSSATGLYQMINSTYSGLVNQYGNQYNVAPGSQSDPTSNALMGGQLIQDNIKTLQNAGISSPTPGQVYIMHFMGNGAGPGFISQAQNNPDAPAASLYPAAAGANKSLFYNSDGSSKTMGQVYGNLTSSIDNKANAYASQYGLPAPCQRGTGTSPAGTATTTSSALQNSVGNIYGNGQCVALVQSVTGVGNTSTWSQGDNVQQAVQSGSAPPIGTGIATFGPNGTYTNSVDGTSHAAVVAGYPMDSNGNVTGITVLEQYAGQPGRLKTYSFNNGSGAVLNNASNYSVINTPTRMSSN